MPDRLVPTMDELRDRRPRPHSPAQLLPPSAPPVAMEAGLTAVRAVAFIALILAIASLLIGLATVVIVFAIIGDAA